MSCLLRRAATLPASNPASAGLWSSTACRCSTERSGEGGIEHVELPMLRTILTPLSRPMSSPVLPSNPLCMSPSAGCTAPRSSSHDHPSPTRPEARSTWSSTRSSADFALASRPQLSDLFRPLGPVGAQIARQHRARGDPPHWTAPDSLHFRSARRQAARDGAEQAGTPGDGRGLAPSRLCTSRAMIGVRWRGEGSPKPTGTSSGPSMPMVTSLATSAILPGWRRQGSESCVSGRAEQHGWSQALSGPAPPDRPLAPRESGSAHCHSDRTRGRLHREISQSLPVQPVVSEPTRLCCMANSVAAARLETPAFA
jgi:hypothetical protein